MRFNTLFFLSVASCLCAALAQVSYDDCCFKYVTKLNRNIWKHAVAYKVQVTDGGCNIPAVIFIMRRGRVVCTDPDKTWVKDLKMKIEKKKNNDPKPSSKWQISA